MPKTILAVAVLGAAAVIAVVAQSQLSNETGVAGDTAEAAPVATPPAAVVPDLEQRTADTVPTAPAAGVVPEPPSGTTREPARPYLRDVPNVVSEETIKQQQATGAAVLQRAADAYAAVKSLRASFVQKRDNPLLGSTTVSRGTLYQKRPDRFLMKFSDPEGDIIVSDGRYFWLYYPSADAKQVLRAPASEGGAGGVDLQAQFLGDPLRRFTHAYHGTETVNGRKTHVITMVPRENVGYKSLKVWVDADDALVRRFVLTENNGLVQEFTLSNLTVNPTLSNDLFAFTPPAGAKIIENP